MSNYNRKRKHRAVGRSNHYRDQDYTEYHHDTQDKFPAFLSHHDAYQASLAHFSTSNQGGLDTEMSMSEDREPAQRQDPLQALYIQAHEADIIRGPNARTTAESLEVVEYVDQTSDSNGLRGGSAPISSSRLKNVKVLPKIGSALIQLQPGGPSTGRASSRHESLASGNGSMRVFDEDEDEIIGTNTPAAPHSTSKNSIWVDRYDARLLLDSPPTSTSTSTSTTHGVHLPLSPTSPTTQTALPGPSSPTGWSDLSSDAEDTFFFDPGETEDFRKEKRRRLLEKTREERLRARREEDGDVADEEPRKEEEEEVWGGADEEPDQTQKDLMSRTATHLLSSPNPAQLEMRILANHGRDRRFAFLRGRWSNAWGLIKAKARVELTKAKEKQEKENQVKEKTGGNVSAGAGLGLLASYGSGSDDDDDDEEEEEEEKDEKEEGVDREKENGKASEENEHPPAQQETVKEVDASTNLIQVQMNEEEMAKEARRKRLKAWSEQRKAAREKGEVLE